MSNCPELDIIPRSAWSLLNPTGELVALALPVDYMVYAHSVTNTCSDREACSKIVQTIQNDHIINKKFFDIGYNFMIGGDGSIFEGRGWHKKGSFARNFNSKGIGTGFIGNFTTEAQIKNTLTFAAAKSAYDLCHCAGRNQYVRNCSAISITSYGAHPVLNGYILNPERLLPTTVTSTTATTRTTTKTPDPTTSPEPTATTTFVETVSITNGTSFPYPSSTAPPDPASSGLSAGEIAGISFGVMALVLVITFLVFLFCRRKTGKTNDYRCAIQKLVAPSVVAYYEKPRWSIDLKNVCLGVGQHGQVYKGALMDKKPQKLRYPTISGCRPVAVKMLRDTGSGCQGTADFLAEMSILMKVGRHVNIVNLEAVVLKGKLLMVMEHCELGSLDTYLRTLKEKSKHLSSPVTPSHSVAFGQAEQSHTQVEINIMELVSIAHQISRGMEHLSSKGIIHRDLAARNILLTADKTVKIADFGMAREQSEYILERDKVPLPVCWMAPESIIPGRGIFTTQSDVWSFGIVLWEIFSLGGIPYRTEFPKGVLPSQLCICLQEGHRLQVPDLCPEYVALLMLKCWNFEPDERPTFSTLKENLESLLPSPERARYIICDAENETLNKTVLSTGGRLD